MSVILSQGNHEFTIVHFIGKCTRILMINSGLQWLNGIQGVDMPSGILTLCHGKYSSKSMYIYIYNIYIYISEMGNLT